MAEHRRRSECTVNHVALRWPPLFADAADPGPVLRCLHIGDEALVEWQSGLISYQSTLDGSPAGLGVEFTFSRGAWEPLAEALRDGRIVDAMVAEIATLRAEAIALQHDRGGR